MQTDTKSWTRFRQELCESCVANCCRGWAVEVSVPDLIRLGLLTEAQAASELPKAVKRLRNKRILEEGDPHAFVFVLARKPNTDCVFLGRDRKCTVYEKRPEICRSFPKIGPRPNHCPYEKRS